MIVIGARSRTVDLQLEHRHRRDAQGDDQNYYGTPIQINGGTLNLAGTGASRYQVVGSTTITGTITKGQTVILDGNITTTGSLTNDGTLTEFQGPSSPFRAATRSLTTD